MRPPASQRLRRTATVSTSIRSGAARSMPAATARRATWPSCPSSARAFTNTEASTTITKRDVPPRGQPPPDRGRPCRRGGARRARRADQWSGARPIAPARQPGTAGATDLAARPDAGAQREPRREDPVPTHLPCLHSASTRTGPQRQVRVLTVSIRSICGDLVDERELGRPPAAPVLTPRVCFCSAGFRASHVVSALWSVVVFLAAEGLHWGGAGAGPLGRGTAGRAPAASPMASVRQYQQIGAPWPPTGAPASGASGQPSGSSCHPSRRP